MKSWLTVVSLGVVVGFVSAAAADNDHDQDRHKRVFRAQLTGFNEVPSQSSPARGQFYGIVNPGGTEFTYWLSYSGFGTSVSQAHIHFGQHHVNGGIVVWLCKGTASPAAGSGVPADVPSCAALETGAPITGKISAEDVIGPVPQGITTGEFAELLAAMRSGAAYANVHSGALPGGEIRGQIN